MLYNNCLTETQTLTQNLILTQNQYNSAQDPPTPCKSCVLDLNNVSDCRVSVLQPEWSAREPGVRDDQAA